MKTVTYIITLTLLTLCCSKKNSLKNQITVVINSIDDKTKLPRINKFDTIDVRIAKIGFPKRRYVKVAEYVTDYKGSVTIKLDKNEEYHFILGGSYIYGATEFSEGELNDGQKVNIEVISLKNQ